LHGARTPPAIPVDRCRMICVGTAVKVRLLLFLDECLQGWEKGFVRYPPIQVCHPKKPQVLVCNFATGWMKLVLGRAVGRKESKSERWGVHMIVKTLCMAAPWVPLAEREAGR
jgi:hypothetical protein